MQQRAFVGAFRLALAVAASSVWFGPATAAAAETGPAETGRGRVVISKNDCAAFAGHTPAPGVQYEPGRDALGRDVAPSDLPGAPSFALPETIRIDLGINVAEKYGLGAGSRYTGEGVIGTVTVRCGTGGPTSTASQWTRASGMRSPRRAAASGPNPDRFGALRGGSRSPTVRRGNSGRGDPFAP